MSETTAILSEIKVSGAKKPSERDFIRDIVKKIEERILMECLTSNDVFLRVDYRSGSVEVRMTSSGENEVMVYHSGNDHESPVLEATITGKLPDWWAIHDMAVEEDRKEQEFQRYLWDNCRYW